MMTVKPIISLPDGAPCFDEDDLGMSLAEYVELAETDREAALAIFLRDVPEAKDNPVQIAILEYGFEAYIEFLKGKFEG